MTPESGLSDVELEIREKEKEDRLHEMIIRSLESKAMEHKHQKQEEATQTSPSPKHPSKPNQHQSTPISQTEKPF